MPLDEKGRQIAYQVAWKAAVELVAAGKVTLTSLDAAGEEIATLANQLFTPLESTLSNVQGSAGTAAAVPPAATPTAAVPASAPSSGSTPTITDTPCPNCERAGRNGVLLHNATGRGPEWRCSLQKRRKAGDRWVDIGECDYQDWGANSTRG